MRRITEQDIRKCGLVPFGRSSLKTATQLFSRLLKNHDTVEISIDKCINASQRKWKWTEYRLIGMQNTNCLLKEILYKPLSEEKKEEFKRKLQNNEIINFNDFQQEQYLDEKTIIMSAGDIACMKNGGQAVIKVNE